jgi:two-component system sensor histidine kinase BaeS
MKVRVADLLKLIQTWLRLMTTDIGKIRDSFQPVDLGVVVTKAVEAVQPHAIRKDIEILVDGLSAPKRVRGDEGTLVEALVNLLNNAVKYSPGGTRVTVTTTEEKGQVAIAVADSGVGISAEDLPRVFQDFYRAASASREQGCGLGLPLSRRIMEAHDGTISATSEPGKGSTFVIRLPALAGSQKTGEDT